MMESPSLVQCSRLAKEPRLRRWEAGRAWVNYSGTGSAHGTLAPKAGFELFRSRPIPSLDDVLRPRHNGYTTPHILSFGASGSDVSDTTYRFTGELRQERCG